MATQGDTIGRMAETEPAPAETSASAATHSEEMAAGLAHEVRNQLNSLQIHLGVLEQELAQDAPACVSALARVRRMARSLASLDDVVTDFLHLSRPSRLVREPVDVGLLLAELAAFLSPEFAARGVSLESDVEHGPRTVEADGPELRRLVFNLAINALEATPSGGRVRIETARSGDALVLTVRDTGAGVPAELAARLFEPFVSGRPGGTGLGLAIARRIAEQHGGSITHASTPDRGTSFEVRLPLRAAQPTHA
jgi:signal transduction histidine kinase